MAVVIGEAAVAVRADPPDASDVESTAGGPILDALGSIGGKGAALLGGLLGGAALGAAFGTAMENAALGDKLSAQLGASGQYAEDLGAIAGSLYADAYGENLGEVNDALRSVIQSGAVMEDASNEQLQSVTSSVMDLASAMDQDVGGTATAVGRMIQTGLAGTAEEALDILTRGFQQGADRGGDLLDVIGEYGSTFTEVGLNGGQAMGLLNQALAAGIPNADFAADALREMGIRGREGSDAAATALKSLGLNAQDYFSAMREGGPAASDALDTVLDALRNTEDPAARSAAAVELVGTQYEDLGDAILQMDPSAAVASLGEVEGAAGKMGDTLNDNAQTNITSFMRTLQQGAVDIIGGQVIPKVQEVVTWVRDNLGPAWDTVTDTLNDTVLPALTAVSDWLDEHQTAAQVMAWLVGGVLAVAFGAWGTAATIAAIQNTIAWIATAAAGSAGAAAAERSALQVAAGWLLMGAQALIQGVKIAAVWTAQIIASAASGAASFAVQVARVVAGWVLMGIQSLIQAGRMAAAWLIAMGPVGWIIAAVIGLVAIIILNWDKIKTFTVRAWNAITEKVSAAWRAVKDAVVTGVTNAVNFVKGLPGKIVTALGNFGSLLYNKGRDLITGLVNGIGAAASFVGGTARKIVNAVIGFVNSSIITGLNNMLDFTIMGVHVNPPDIPHIPTLHSGGIFDSGSGEGLALLRDQERVITPEQRVIADNLLRDLLGGSLPAGAAGTGGTTVGGTAVQIDVHAAPGMSVGELAAHVGADLGWQLSTGATAPPPLVGAAP